MSHFRLFLFHASLAFALAACGSTSSSKSQGEQAPPVAGEESQAKLGEAPRASAEEKPEPFEKKAKIESGLQLACSQAQDFESLSFEEGEGWREKCKPAFDCERPLPVKPCCLALTPECESCMDEGRNAQRAFTFACFGETEPLPAVLDCSQAPPLQPCCKALLPKCLDCVAKNRYLDGLYERLCEAPATQVEQPTTSP